MRYSLFSLSYIKLFVNFVSLYLFLLPAINTITSGVTERPQDQYFPSRSHSPSSHTGHTDPPGRYEERRPPRDEHRYVLFLPVYNG